jgi:hypothetical protein
MYGGYGYPLATSPVPQGPGFLSDLWFWEGSAAVGAWIPANPPVFINSSGKYQADETPLELINSAGAYTAVGSVGTPGARWGATPWTDASGNLWMFAGQGYDSTGVETGLLNDTWEWISTGPDPNGTGIFLGTWIWQAGPNTSNHAGVYDTQGVASASNIPGGRWAAASYVDASGNLWMVGGQAYDSAGHIGLLKVRLRVDGGKGSSGLTRCKTSGCSADSGWIRRGRPTETSTTFGSWVRRRSGLGYPAATRPTRMECRARKSPPRQPMFLVREGLLWVGATKIIICGSSVDAGTIPWPLWVPASSTMSGSTSKAPASGFGGTAQTTWTRTGPISPASPTLTMSRAHGEARRCGSQIPYCISGLSGDRATTRLRSPGTAI